MDERMLLLPASLAQKIVEHVMQSTSPLPVRYSVEIIDGLRQLQPVVLQQPQSADSPKEEPRKPPRNRRSGT